MRLKENKGDIAMNMLKTVMRFILKVFWIFPVKKNKIFLMSFDGTSYGYDSRAIAEYIINQFPNEYELHWGTLKNKELNGVIPEIELNRIESIPGFLHMITSGILIYNINPPSYIPFRKEQILINTWHGFAYKKVGKYAPHFDAAQFSTSTCFLSHSKTYTEQILKESFCYAGDILECGVPRNDIFFKKDELEYRRVLIKRRIGINQECKVVIFAPTFRGDFVFEKADLNFLKLKEGLENKFGGEWKILYRMHPMIADKYKILDKDVIDVSKYPDMQDLLVVSDILVTDYSSSMWDFALMKRPVFLFATDVAQYSAGRGVYYPVEDWPFPMAESNQQLSSIITNFDNTSYLNELNNYFDKMGSFENGTACEQVMRYIRKQQKQL